MHDKNNLFAHNKKETVRSSDERKYRRNVVGKKGRRFLPKNQQTFDTKNLPEKSQIYMLIKP